MNNLAMLLVNSNRFTEAEQLLQQALKINEQSYKANHPHVANVLHNLAALLYQTNRVEKAEPLMRQGRKIIVQCLGAEHPTAQRASANYLLILQALGKSPAEIQALMASQDL